ncbi:MAG: hypothetical protein JWN48_4634 [Myxococcaceae bacterium]|nr:hypothetical protein [Myxococcaceae bacterium]
MTRCAARLLLALGLAGCQVSGAPSPSGASAPGAPASSQAPVAAARAPSSAKPTAAPTAALSSEVVERKLGAEPQLPGDPVPVAQVLSAPEPYLGKPVKCEGKVARVCQAAGCWLELQSESGGEGLRVPMAAHAFFVPQDAVGHVAIVEGELKRHELPETQKKHYEGEGMKAVGPLSLDATSVVLR